MAKEQPIFHNSTGVWINPGTAAFELTGKARDEQMAEMDKSYRKMAGLPDKKQEDKIAKLAIDLLTHIVTTGVAAQSFVTMREVNYYYGCNLQEMKAAVQRCIVDSPAIYELVNVRDEVPQPYRLKSISASRDPDFMVRSWSHRVMTPDIDELGEKAGLRFPTVFLYAADHGSPDSQTLYDSALLVNSMLKDAKDDILDQINPKKIVIIGFIVHKEDE